MGKSVFCVKDLKEQSKTNFTGIKVPGIFHSPQWEEVLADTYRYRPFNFFLTEDQEIKAFVPLLEVNSFITGKRAVSLPFTDFCSPYSKDQNYFNELLEYIKDIGIKNRWKYFELRGGEDLLKDYTSSEMFYEHVIDLRLKSAELWKSLKENVKRNVRKARSYEVKIEISGTYDSLKKFIRLNSITRKKHGLPPQPDKFFINLYKKVISKGNGFIFNAVCEKRTIASNIFLMHDKSVLYKYGASLMKYQHLRANTLLMWEAMKYFADNGYSELSLGRTHPDDEGLLQFKKGFCPDVKKIFYYRYDIRKETFTRNATAHESPINYIFRCMPLFMLRNIGCLIYRHFA